MEHLDDRELNELLSRWQAPATPPQLRARVFAPSRRWRLLWLVPLAACLFVVLYLERHGQYLATGTGFARASPNRVHRFLADRPTTRCFGYDLVVEPINGSERYRVSFEPLDVDVPQTVSLGDTVALDILASPDNRRKVVDYIQLYKLPF